MRNEEKFISIKKSFYAVTLHLPGKEPIKTFVHIEFKNSFFFLWSSLENLAKSLADKDFAPLERRFGKDWKLLTGKQVFPYRFLRSVKSLDHKGLVPIEEFGSRFGQGELFQKGQEKGVEVKPISDEDYEHYKTVSTELMW